jgi:hypothetical protein
MCAFLSISLIAKNYYIQNKNLRYELEITPGIHKLMSDAFVRLSNLGTVKITEDSVDDVVTNFREFSQVAPMSIEEITLDEIAESFSKKSFFSCLKELSDIFYAKRVKEVKTFDTMMAEAYLNKKRGNNSGLCSMFLGNEYSLIDDKNLLTLLEVNRALGENAEVYNELFLKAYRKSNSSDRYLALTLILNEMAYDVLVNQKSSLDLNKYKASLVMEIEIGSELLSKRLTNENESDKVPVIIKADSSNLKEEIKGIK